MAGSAEGEAQAQRAGEQRAREIAHERTERARVVGAGAGGHDERRRAGILESVQQGARSLVSAVGRMLGVASRDTTTEDKVGECRDYSADKAMECLTLRTEEVTGASKVKVFAQQST